jgi:hypothetical protein
MFPPSLRRVLLGTALAGAAIGAAPALASAASTCTLDETTHRATVVDGSGAAPLRILRSGNFLAAEDGSGPLVFCDGATSFATVTNTDRVNVLGNSSSQSTDGYIVDASHGALAPGRTTEADGNSEIEVVVTQLDNAGARLAYIGTEGPDTVRLSASGLMAIGPDGDLDVVIGNTGSPLPPYRASTLAVSGGGGADFLSGRGIPGFVGGPASVPVELSGGRGNDTVVDGGTFGDHINGDQDADTLFSVDGHFDFVNGGSEFDSATVDKADSVQPDVESTTIGTVGKARLAKSVVAGRPGGTATLDVGWTHPKSWRDLRGVMVRLFRGTEKLAMINVAPRGGRLTADGAVKLMPGSQVTHHGRTVHARLALRLGRSLRGQTLRVAVAATDRDGRTQTVPEAGALKVAR